MHHWGDGWDGWSDLHKAVDMLYDELARYGIHTPGCSLKEKFGTIRNYERPRGVTNLHDVCWPGYGYRQWPANKLGDWLWDMDIYVWPHVFAWTGITWVTRMIQRAGYRHAYTRVVQRFPHISTEILVDADQELLGDMFPYGDHWEGGGPYRPQHAGWKAYLKQNKRRCG